jgi:AAHS family 3-hydroxyphenylpropionic acid transporter
MTDVARRRPVALVIGLCSLAAILEGYDIQAFGVAAPKLVAALGLNPAQQGTAASAATIGLVLGAILGGKLGDIAGRKPILLLSVAIFGAASLWTASTSAYAMLLLARFVTGVGFGGAFPVLIAIATETSSPRWRGATTCALFCGMPLGGSLVSLFASLAGEQLNWRTIFVVGGLLPLIILPALWFALHETKPPRDENTHTRLLPALFGGGRAAATILLGSASFVAFVVLYLMLNWLPALIVAKGYLSGDGAAASLGFNVAGVLGGLLLGFLTDTAGPRRALLLAYATIFAGLALLAGAQSLGLIVAYSALLGLFAPGTTFVLYALVPPYYPANVRAAACGAIVGIGRLGTIVGPLLAGELRQMGWSAEHVLDALLPAIAIGGTCAFLLTTRFSAANISPVLAEG